MEKERKSRLMRSYINEIESDEEDKDIIEISGGYIISLDKDKKDNKDNIEENDVSEPLISDNHRNSSHSNKSNRDSRSKFTGENIEDKQMLYDMGFKFQLINTIYNNMHPINLQEALDYLNKNDKGKFTHSYIENERFICTICNQGRYAHENTAIFVEDTNTNTGNDLIIGVNTNDGNNNNNNDVNLLPIGNINNNNNTISSRQNRSSSDRFNRFESSYLNSINKKNNIYSYSNPKDCGICGDKIESVDLSKVKINCGHNFCVDCWENYLQEKINNANVGKISCMQHGCSVVLSEYFIKKILENDETLIKKYEKFLERQKLLMSNKNIKFCPIPDCDGYAEKKEKKYVKCNFGHDFCFECLKQPHGSKNCDDIIDADFEEWKKHKIVKRCPKCKIWTEKNEGCNHMTCVECRFQWCWLCQKQYSSTHYSTGTCKGLQFLKEQDEKKIQKLMRANIPKCACLRNAIKEFLIFLLFIFLSPYYYFFRYIDDLEIDRCYENIYMASVVPVFISYEILFFSFILIIVLPGLICSEYFRELYVYVKDSVL